MARPPSYVSIPDKAGIFPVDEQESLYYELRGISTTITTSSRTTTSSKPSTTTSKHRVVIVMGAFGTLRWVDYLADKLAAQGHEVLTYNHRGVGVGFHDQYEHVSPPASPCSLVYHHTCELLAQDAWRLIDHVWGGGTDDKIHLYGASMGGFVVQQMALQELRRIAIAQEEAAKTQQQQEQQQQQQHQQRLEPRIASLFMAVTSRGVLPSFLPGLESVNQWIMPVFYRTGLIRLATPFLLARTKERMLHHLLEKCFSATYLTSAHPESGETMRIVWERAWSDNYHNWNTFHQPETCLNQIMVMATHFLRDRDAEILRESGVHIKTALFRHINKKRSQKC